MKIYLLQFFLLIGLGLNLQAQIPSNPIRGKVTCNGTGVPGVVVTDGIDCVLTDQQGQYTLPPNRNVRFIYLSTPSGYLPKTEQTIPLFYQKLNPAKQDIYDFELVRNPQNEINHLFLVQADAQVTSEDDVKAYAKYLQDMKEYIRPYMGKKEVFGIDCGDIVGDTPSLYPSYIDTVSSLEIPIYRAIGNHDMTYGGRTFEYSYRTFESYFGPIYYSLNKGNAHYIVLDNCFYVNRDYQYIGYIDERTFQWLEKDLSYVPKDKLVFVVMHTLQFTKRRFRDAKETMSMLEDALLNFSGSVNPITVSTMQLLVGDESLQFRFVNSKTNPVQVSHNITYNTSTKVLTAPAGILQHLTLGISSLSSSHKADEYKYWDMAEYNSPTLIDPEKKYYLYAKVGKENQAGTFLLSETAIKMEQIAGYYHLLTGVLNSEYEGSRSFVELYGFTEILPGRVTTERIISPDGKTYFDLVKGEIGGNIQIKAGSSGLENLSEWEAAHKEIEDAGKAAEQANNAVEGLHNYVDGAFADGIITEAEAKAIEKYINTINNAKAAIEATYNKLYTNVYLSGSAKTGLLNAKVTLMGCISDLINAINTAIADGLTTPEEKQNVDANFAYFNSAYADFNTAVESANRAIQDKLKEFSDTAMKEALQALQDAEDAGKAAEQANSAVSGLHDYVDGAFADGIITKAEALAIEKYLNTVKNTRAAVEATYNKLYANSYLEGEAKTGLLNAKISLFGAIDNLIAAINVAINDGQITVEEKRNVDDKFALFNSALASFNTAVEVANKAIQDKLKDYSDQCFAELKVLNTQISAQVTRVDSLTQRIDTAGWITTADGNKIYASKELESGNTLISYINQAAGETTIHSSKINLQGVVTISSLNSELQATINGKADSDKLGALAELNSVGIEHLGSTIIDGDTLNTGLIKVRHLDADSGFIGGFTIENGRLVWTRSDYFGGTSRSLKLGSGTAKEGVVNVTFNAATDGKFGVCAVGATAGGSAAIYGSSKSNPTYPSNYIYAGFFDGNVNVLGDVSANGFYPRDGNGNTMDVVSDIWVYGLKDSNTFGYRAHIVKGIIVELKNT